MESLFGRFPHLVEDIFGLLNGKTLSSCSQINKIWKENLEEYRLHLVKKIQNRLKNQNIVYGPVEDSDKEENKNSPKIPIRTLSISTWSTRIKKHPVAPERNITVEQLPLPDLVKILNYFCDYDGVFFLFLSHLCTVLESPSQPNANSNVQNFLLSWEDHPKNIVEALLDLKQPVDVTLACGEYNFTVHKIVLSVCSPYFR